MRFFGLWVLALACGVVSAGGEQPPAASLTMPSPPSCLGAAPPVITTPPPVPPPHPPAAREQTPVGRSVQGRAIRCRVYGNGGDCVLVLGGIHGNEPASVPICEELCSFLARHPEMLRGRRVVVAPATNPDGLAANRRTNSHGVDLNRNFDTSNRQAVRRYGLKPLSEPESRYIARLIERYRPARIVSVHQPLACVDWDGPARDLAGAMSRACGLPMRKLGARPGSLGSYAGVDLHIPIITLELPRGASGLTPSDVWRTYGQALLVSIHYRDAAMTAK